MDNSKRNTELPSEGAIVEAVRAALSIAADDALSIHEVTEHTNVNYVFHVTGRGVSVFVKAATSKLKAFDFHGPRERVAREAAYATRFGELCGHLLEIPRVVFLDNARYLVGLQDVGEGRGVLLDVLKDDYETCASGGALWGKALGSLARSSRVTGPVRPDERPMGQALWLTILKSSAARLFPDAIGGMLEPMSERAECLVHTDLWGKNILVGKGRRPAVVDFENAGIGDPAVDVSALLTALLIPVVGDQLARAELYAGFVADFTAAYLAGIDDPTWGNAVILRSFHAVSANLGLRAVGISPYKMSDPARERVVRAAQSLFREPPQSPSDFVRAATLGS